MSRLHVGSFRSVSVCLELVLLVSKHSGSIPGHDLAVAYVVVFGEVIYLPGSRAVLGAKWVAGSGGGLGCLLRGSPPQSMGESQGLNPQSCGEAFSHSDNTTTSLLLHESKSVCAVQSLRENLHL